MPRTVKTPTGPQVEAYGNKGMQSKRWRKVFANQQAFENWCDKHASDVVVLGVRDVEASH